MSSPYYLKGNGMAERSVQSTKRLLKKAKETGEDPYLMLLEWRNTPITGIGSPTQLLMGRRTRTTMPVSPALLKPTVPRDDIPQILMAKQQTQKEAYDRSAKIRPEMFPGQDIYVRTGDRWEPAVLKTPTSTPRSYIIQKDGREYRRNSKDLMTPNVPGSPLRKSVSTEPAIPESTEPVSPVIKNELQKEDRAQPQSVETPLRRVSRRVIRPPRRYIEEC